MIKSFAKLLCIGALLWLAACGGATANLQIFNGSPDSPPVDVLVNGNVVAFNMNPDIFSQYQGVSAGDVDLRVNETGTSRTLVQLQQTLVGDASYTMIILNFVSQLEAMVLTDDNSIDQPTTAKIRLVNAAPSSAAFDFYVTAPGVDLSTVSPLLSNLTFKQVSPYIVLGASTYEVRATQAGTKTILIDSGNFVLGPGQVRTGVTVDKVGGGTPFNIVFLPDQI